MGKRKTAIIVIGLAVVLTGYVLTLRDSNEQMSSENRTVATGSDFNLGITYLTVTPGVADRYSVEAHTGALITAVARDGIADQLGIRTGDVIVSFNGVSLRQEAPLFGMMHGCHSGQTVVLEIWTVNGNKTVEFIHAAN